MVLHRGRGWSSGSRALPSTVQHNQPQQGHEHRDRREQDVVDHDHTRSSPCAGTMPEPFHQKDHAAKQGERDQGRLRDGALLALTQSNLLQSVSRPKAPT